MADAIARNNGGMCGRRLASCAPAAAAAAVVADTRAPNPRPQRLSTAGHDHFVRFPD